MEDENSKQNTNQTQNGYRKVSSYKEKTKSSFGKNVFVPFVTSIIGTTLVIGVCFGVPEVKNKLMGNSTRKYY